jgi:hypothetical protein
MEEICDYGEHGRVYEETVCRGATSLGDLKEVRYGGEETAQEGGHYLIYKRVGVGGRYHKKEKSKC